MQNRKMHENLHIFNESKTLPEYSENCLTTKYYFFLIFFATT